jgi:hypothetical protein
MKVFVVIRVNGDTCNDEFQGVFDHRSRAAAYIRKCQWRAHELHVLEWEMNTGEPDPDPNAITRIRATASAAVEP